MQNTFLANTKAEFLKCKGIPLIWLTLLIAAILPALNFITFLERADIFSPMFKKDAWNIMLMRNWKDGATISFPVYTVLITAVLIQIEYRNNTWKQVYTLPRTYADIYLSKFIVIQSLLILFLLCFNAFVLLEGWLLLKLNNNYNFADQHMDWNLMFLLSCRIYIGVLAISALQYWFSLRFKHFITPIVIGLGLLIIGPAFTTLGKAIFYPYLYPQLMFSADIRRDAFDYSLSTLTVISLISFILLLFLGFLQIRQQKERG